MNNSNNSGASTGHRRSMTGQEATERRASIQAIMRDPNLAPQEKRKSIQALMDGRERRRSSTAAPANGITNGSAAGGGMAVAAAMAAADFVDSDDESDYDDHQNEMHDSINNLGGPQKSDMDDSNRSGNGSATKKRSSFIFKRGSSNITNEKSGKRRTSLRESFTMGFSKMGVKGSSNSGDMGESANVVAASMCVPTPESKIAISKRLEKSRPPCQHYERNCSIVSPCCGLVFGCRICHDDTEELPPPFLLSGGMGPQPSPEDLAKAGMTNGDLFAASMPNRKVPAIVHRSASMPSTFEEEETHHEIDRFLIKEVVCRECFTRQSSKTNNCINCGIQFGTYHCSTCNLWMSADEDPYHCLKCGFCRVGGRENFTHCDDCGMCIDALLFEDHNCKSGKYMSNCPVCQEDLFSSRMASHEMPCGHAIHWHCFRELTSHDTRCPVCKKTAETHDQMEQTWNAMAMGIALQPVPADMARVVDILCNDCEGKSANQRWHFLGVQCRRCTSFNTTVERTVLVGQEAADFLGPTSDIAAQAQWASGMADQNVLAALMGGGNSPTHAGLPNGGSSDDSMESETLNQSVAAEVMSLMNRGGANQSFPGDRDEMDGDDDGDDDNEDANPNNRDEGDEMDQS